MTRYTKEETTEALVILRKRLTAGDTVHTTLSRVMPDRLTCDIRVLAMVEGQSVDISYSVARAIGLPMHNGAVRVGGCGMDMGFHIVYSLARVLFPAPKCIGEDRRCPSNDHVNARPVEGTYGPTVVHSDGGYMLRHRWL